MEGHTDNNGAAAHNKMLSNQRANAVLKALIADGIEQSRLVATGFGADKPLVANDSEDNKAKNRRVELVRQTKYLISYFQVKPLGMNGEVELTDGFREDNGVFISLHGATSSMGVNTSAGIITYINTNLQVGEIWKDEVTLNVSGVASWTIKHINEGRILERAASVTINGKTYKDVVKAETKKTIVVSTANSTTKITFETWLAKGIGLIYEKTSYGDGHDQSYGMVSYSVK